MNEDIEKSIKTFCSKLSEMYKYLEIEDKKRILEELELKSGKVDFWNDQKIAKETIDKIKSIKIILDPFFKISNLIDDLKILYELIESDDEDTFNEISVIKDEISYLFEKLELQVLLGDEFDECHAYLTLHAGAGGTESCDWADMLFRMFTRFVEREDFSFQILDIQPGDEAGIKSVTLLIEGSYAYGLLKSERGVHRLVRISPFDSQSRRHTSFTAVDISPKLDDEVEVEIIESDLRVDTYRAQGAGGQHVNTTDSAVRIVHLPSGTVVQCQAERSQHKNKATAINMLKAKLYEIEQDKKRKAIDQLYSDKGDIAWGSQIRSYVMQPYTLVKDHRTDEQIGNVQDVLDGNIKRFIFSYLKRLK